MLVHPRLALLKGFVKKSNTWLPERPAPCEQEGLKEKYETGFEAALKLGRLRILP